MLSLRKRINHTQKTTVSYFLSRERSGPREQRRVLVNNPGSRTRVSAK